MAAGASGCLAPGLEMLLTLTSLPGYTRAVPQAPDGDKGLSVSTTFLLHAEQRFCPYGNFPHSHIHGVTTHIWVQTHKGTKGVLSTRTDPEHFGITAATRHDMTLQDVQRAIVSAASAVPLVFASPTSGNHSSFTEQPLHL